jgi:hypothetical protein
LIGLAGGFAAAVLLYPTVIRTQSETTPDSEPETVGEAQEIGGIADVVDGFPDTLVLAIRSDGQSLGSMIWPRGGAAYSRSIPVGVPAAREPVTFDASGRIIAALARVGGELPGVLYTGVPQSASILAGNVTGYAWHDSAPYEIAYTTATDDVSELWLRRSRGSEPELAGELEAAGRIAAWGDWGHAIQDDPGNSFHVVGSDGQMTTYSGRLLDSGPSGALVMESDGIGYILLGSTEVKEVSGAESALAARFSDDGERLAVLGSEWVAVVSLVDGSERRIPAGAPGLSQLVWSSDGRFIVYPGRNRLWVIDTQSDAAYEVLAGHVIAGVGIVPPGS